MKYSYAKIKHSNKSFSPRKRIIFIISLFFYGIIFYFTWNNILFKYFLSYTSTERANNENPVTIAENKNTIEQPHNERFIPTPKNEQPHNKSFVVNTPGCKIPYFDAFDENVRKFIKKPKSFVCNNGIPALLESNQTSIYLITSSLPAYNVTDRHLLKCAYSSFFRAKPKEDESDKKIIFSKVWYNFTESIEIAYEYIRAVCYYNHTIIYEDMFSFVPISIPKPLKTSTRPPLNVLVLGLDSVSRLNLHRQMPQTVNYLKHLEAVELLGYNKVADNTFPNIIPVLTGLTEEELNRTCLLRREDYFDTCPFIWNHYKNRGYITAYGEDTANLGLFSYGYSKGFKKQPTDFYYSYFSRYVEKTIGNNFYLNTYICQGSRYVYEDLLKYVKKYVYTLKHNALPYFGFFWEVSISHDDFNLPSKADWDYYQFFKALDRDDILENTAVIFMSDHGLRFGEIRQTYQGRMEERLPFVFLLLPNWFKKNYKAGVDNLLENTGRLTTPFDLHETLMDLLYQEDNPTEKTSRGYSLFGKISANRTCDEAGIASHWCTCQEIIEINTIDSIVVKSAQFVVDYINRRLVGLTECSSLTLSEIISASLSTNENGIKEEFTIQDYMVGFVTTPGEAVFEATVRHTSDEMKTIGTVERLNLYAQQSYCISDNKLKMFCFCKEKMTGTL